MPTAGMPGWVGPTIAISLLIIALLLVALAVGLLMALKQIKAQVEQQRSAVKEAKDLLDMIGREAEAVVRTSRTVRKYVVRGTKRARDKLLDLEALYDVMYQEVEDAAIDAATTLRAVRRGTGVLGKLRRLVIPGR